MNHSKEVIGIMGAMPQEIVEIVTLLKGCSSRQTAHRTFYSGNINNQEVVVVYSQWGKVAAALTATILVNIFHVTRLVFTGAAGSLDRRLNVGDVVIGSRLVQHDFDGRPLCEQYYIPYFDKIFVECDERLTEETKRVVSGLLQKDTLKERLGIEVLSEFQIDCPRCYVGDIASGDCFIGTDEQKKRLSESLPTVLCAEMEGAAVAQVCSECGIPFIVIRYISDAADGKAGIDFPAFMNRVASPFSREIVREMCGSAIINGSNRSCNKCP